MDKRCSFDPDGACRNHAANQLNPGLDGEHRVNCLETVSRPNLYKGDLRGEHATKYGND
jgi:hypothetical protein